MVKSESNQNQIKSWSIIDLAQLGWWLYKRVLAVAKSVNWRIQPVAFQKSCPMLSTLLLRIYLKYSQVPSQKCQYSQGGHQSWKFEDHVYNTNILSFARDFQHARHGSKSPNWYHPRLLHDSHVQGAHSQWQFWSKGLVGSQISKGHVALCHRNHHGSKRLHWRHPRKPRDRCGHKDPARYYPQHEANLPIRPCRTSRLLSENYCHQNHQKSTVPRRVHPTPLRDDAFEEKNEKDKSYWSFCDQIVLSNCWLKRRRPTNRWEDSLRYQREPTSGRFPKQLHVQNVGKGQLVLWPDSISPLLLASGWGKTIWNCADSKSPSQKDMSISSWKVKQL